MTVRDRLVRKIGWIRSTSPIVLEGTLGRWRRILATGFQQRTVLFYPEELSIFAAFWKICRFTNCRISHNPHAPCDLAVFWDGSDVRRPDAVLVDLAARTRVINLNCRDFSKTAVNVAMTRIFGYDLALDPRSHHGSCLRKSDRNGTHDGKIVACPIERLDDGYVYQKIVNNEIGADLVEDLRVPIFKHQIPFVYLKHRRRSHRFASENAYAEIVETDRRFSAEEHARILALCAFMGLEYGELDVLRDKDDRRIYVVDVNPTPFGPPNHIDPKHRKAALRKLADAFEKTFLTS